ncbi:MAG: SRPBCC family protein [Deltaproteobacteria bacterium]|nr:SRPBCC family protein [Deltaproteobacteria bacterium]
MSPALLLAAALLTGATTDASALLDRGPIVSIEQTPDGKFKQCTALARVDAPIDRVWQVATNYKDFHTFMPKVVASDVIHEEPGIVDVKFEIDVPGVNTKYVMRHSLHPDTHTIEMNWVKGDLKGSHWVLHMESTPDGKTLISYSGASKNFSSILEGLEDSQQTISVGVNVSSALTVVKAFKQQAEAK